MVEIETYAEAGAMPSARMTLPFDLRQKSRLRARLDNGVEAMIFLERGRIMRSGDLLLGKDGTVVEVVAAEETVSTVRAPDALALTRGAYHLGNRHVPLQVSEGFLRYQHDHVLDEMVRGLGLAVTTEKAPFEPEAGAYGGGHRHGDENHADESHQHGHDHHHGDGHEHGHHHHHGHGHDHG